MHASRGAFFTFAAQTVVTSLLQFCATSRTNQSERTMERSRPRGTPEWAARTMERHVIEACACLDGDMHLVPLENAADLRGVSSAPPIPWIVVVFRAEPTPSVVATANTCDTSSSAGSLRAAHDVVLEKARDKLLAIRFLSLVACCPGFSWRGNPYFWKHVLYDICGAPSGDGYFSVERLGRSSRRRLCFTPASGAGDVREMPKFRLIFPKVKFTDALLGLLSEALSSNSSGGFRLADQRVEAFLSRIGASTPQQHTVEIDLNFSASRLRMMNSGNGVEDILEAASGQRGSSISPSKVFFKARCLDLSDTTVSERDLAPLAHVMTLPALSVSHLKLDWVFTAQSSKRFMRSFCEFVAACFSYTFAVNGDDRSKAAGTPLTRLCLGSSALSAFQLASLFSAIHDGGRTRGIRDLSLRWLEGRDSWLWLAFGIFHPHSRSRIESLNLSYCMLRLEDVRLARSLVESSDVAPYLIRRQNNKNPAHRRHDAKNRWVLLRAGTRLEVPRDTTKRSKGRPGPALTLQEEIWCAALETGASWTCVLVPAYGKLYVKNWHISNTEVRRETECVDGSVARDCKLKSLTMEAVKTDSRNLGVRRDGGLRGPSNVQPVDRVLSEWLETVGRSLQTLQLCSNPLASRTLAAVLGACPRLTTLDVRECELPDIAPITRAFRREDCNLRTLNAGHNHISSASQEELFNLLGDPECDSIRTLQVLQLQDNPTSPSNRILRSLHASLRRNTTIRHLALPLKGNDSATQDIRYRFEKYHQDKWLGYEALPFQHRLAVLSVPMMKSLPIATIEIVYDFSRQAIFRHVVWD